MAAFNESFSAPSPRRESPSKSPGPEEPTTIAESIFTYSESSSEATESTSASSPPPSQAEEESWKQEYEEQVKAWRAQSAEAREKAELVREQWEAKRAAEREEAEKRKAAGTFELVPEVIPGPPIVAAAVQDEKIEVKEAEKEEETDVASSIISQPDTLDSSQKWEEVNSPATSSYPSMSFPEQSATPPLQHHDHDHHQPRSQPALPPQSVTLSVFDSSLSTRTRLKALASSIAINLLLPFVNGVMLGFGEIFAKNFVLGWLGWGSTATTVGISQRSRRQAGLR
ncbi:hypothetical protein P691DRAFT_798216 [Macrolepiota fuliginosa MF-IS2]|uniref:Uncharacterized protein n=1 Tax=Macrolepiota fuliginosa MF-IS2 TaxID=1400762 RepID=A0A9P5XID6_9AGAR|nr:hypothetical protein P691DRAFT_798216 [Macrolepiota fuliginosa MF-IS2]